MHAPCCLPATGTLCSALVVAQELAKALNVDVNQLPLTLGTG